MKIPYAKIESFVKSPDRDINFILVYGPDAGLVSTRTKIISKTVLDDLSDPFRVADFSYDKIKDEPALFVDEINALSLTGGRRLVKIRTGSAALSKDISEIINSAKNDSMVIFEAGDLTPTSSLRKFFEKAKNAAAVPCYKDEGAAIQKVVSEKLSGQGFSFDYDVAQYLAQSFSGDRLVIINEVEKLITYMGDIKHISLKDVRDAIYDSSEFSLDDLCMAFASRNAYETEKSLTKALGESISPIAIIRTMLRYFMRLQEVKVSIAKGATEQQAMSSLRPPVFFKQLPVFKRHLSMWRTKDINMVIKKFIDLEIECKKTGSPAELLCARMFIILPLMVK